MNVPHPRYGIFLFLALLTSCGSLQRVESMRDLPEYRDMTGALEIVDVPELSMFVLKFSNQSARDVCLSGLSWPAEGRITGARGESWIERAGERFSPVPSNPGYCVSIEGVSEVPSTKPNDCLGTRVLASSEKISFVRYENFELPEELFRSEKTLRHKVFGRFC